MNKEKTILVTGGAGFIGSNFIKFLLEEIKDVQIINLDKQTYAGQGMNLEHMGLARDGRYGLIVGDIADRELVSGLFAEHNFDYVFNFAAESHVDRSWVDDAPFRKTNIIGVGVLLKYAVGRPNLKCFMQISTDEVYGSIKDGSWGEQDEVNPRNPYSKCKREAEVLAQHYAEEHKVPIIITRSTNNFGPYQFPEKLLPLFITNLIEGKKVPLMWSEENPGLNVRDWLHVKDNCRAIWHIVQNGSTGEIYNVAGHNERTNREMTQKLLNNFGCGEEMIERISHRPQHDFRYSIDDSKLLALGFKHEHKDLDGEIEKLCNWYKENKTWWEAIKKR